MKTTTAYEDELISQNEIQRFVLLARASQQQDKANEKSLADAVLKALSDCDSAADCSEDEVSFGSGDVVELSYGLKERLNVR